MTPDNFQKEIKNILSNLKEKEKDILINRFGLLGEKAQTLAAIGKNLNLTRERIRQIQNASLSKIKKSAGQEEGIFGLVQKIIKNQGGLATTSNLENKLKTNANLALFLLEAAKNLKRIKGYKNLSSTFINQDLDQKNIIEAEKEIYNLLKKQGKAQKIEKLISAYQKTSKKALPETTSQSLLSASKSFAFDWRGYCGLSIWREVNPKSARDKSYYILKKEERPLHFTHIAELISQENFKGKNPTAATVHNELILDSRFVLVGRGIYALSAWGFRGGTVEEVIAEILRLNPKGLLRDDIITEVLKNKLVARNTVMINLLIKKRFKQDKKGLYKLAR